MTRRTEVERLAHTHTVRIGDLNHAVRVLNRPSSAGDLRDALKALVSFAEPIPTDKDNS